VSLAVATGRMLPVTGDCTAPRAAHDSTASRAPGRTTPTSRMRPVSCSAATAKAA
jgi:hypothetical protein